MLKSLVTGLINKLDEKSMDNKAVMMSVFMFETMIERLFVKPFRNLNYYVAINFFTVIQISPLGLKLTENVWKPCMPVLLKEQADWISENKIRYRFVTKNNIDYHLMFYRKKDAALFVMFLGGQYVR